MGAIALSSVKSSGQLLALSSRAAARGDGLLLSLVAVQSNATGSFAWVYDYGWVGASVSAVYLNGGLVDWGSSCAGGSVSPGRLCAFSLPAGSHGQVILVFGGEGESLDFEA